MFPVELTGEKVCDAKSFGVVLSSRVLSTLEVVSSRKLRRILEYATPRLPRHLKGSRLAPTLEKGQTNNAMFSLLTLLSFHWTVLFDFKITEKMQKQRTNEALLGSDTNSKLRKLLENHSLHHILHVFSFSSSQLRYLIEMFTLRVNWTTSELDQIRNTGPLRSGCEMCKKRYLRHCSQDWVN